MRRITIVIAGFILFSASIYRPGKGVDVFSQLYNLQGMWKIQNKKGFVFEEWKLINKDYLQGCGGVIRGNDTVVNERMLLESRQGEIFYTSIVEDQNNNQPIEFSLTSSEHRKFVFENATHDFPKRIVYEISGSDSLHAWVDDGTDDLKKRQDFNYKKSE